MIPVLSFAPDILTQPQPGALIPCTSSGRCRRSLRMVKQQGAETIYHRDGGIVAWQNAEFTLLTTTEEASE